MPAPASAASARSVSRTVPAIKTSTRLLPLNASESSRAILSANDTAVQRRRGEGAQRPTPPPVCNGGLSGDPLRSEGEKGYGRSRKQPQKAEQSFSMDAEKHGRERRLKSVCCDGYNATGQCSGGHYEHGAIQTQCKESGSSSP